MLRKGRAKNSKEPATLSGWARLSIPLRTSALYEAILGHGLWHLVPGIAAIDRIAGSNPSRAPSEADRLGFGKAVLVMSKNRGTQAAHRLRDLAVGLGAAEQAIRGYREASPETFPRREEVVLDRIRSAQTLLALLRDTQNPLLRLTDHRFEAIAEDAGAPQIAVEVAHVAALTCLARLQSFPGADPKELAVFAADIEQSRQVLACDASILLVNILSTTRHRLRDSVAGELSRMIDPDRHLYLDAGFAIEWLISPENELGPRERNRLAELRQERDRARGGEAR